VARNSGDKMERDEIAKELRKLERSTFFKTIWIVSSHIALLLLANICIIAIDTMYVNSVPFCFLGGMVNGIFIFSSMKRDISKERDRVNKEVQRIFKK
jgi:hypothetical protein